MKRVVLLILIAIFVQGIFAQTEQPKRVFDFARYGIRIEPEKRLIVVMAALDAGGLETELTSKGVVFRNQLREDLKLSLKSDTREKLTTFISQYKRRHPNDTPAEIAAPFISLAYALGPVPELTDPKKVDDLPGDLLEIFDFAPLVREFYRNSGIELKMPQYLRSYQAIGDLLNPSARQMALELCDYLHTRPQLAYTEKIVTKTGGGKGKGKALAKTETRIRDRRFFIVPDLLTPIKTVNFRNIGDEYFAIVPPDTNLLSSEVRRGYLQFIADTLIAENITDITPHKEAIKSLLDNARQQIFDKQKAKDPKLSIDDVYMSPDIYLAVGRSFIAAADVKELEFRKTQFATFQAREKIDKAKTTEDKLKVSAELQSLKDKFADESALRLSNSYENGAVLAFYFAQQFKGLEESGFDVAGSFKDMLQTLDPLKEKDRISQFADARNRAVKAREAREKQLRQEILVDNLNSRKDEEFFGKLYEVNDIIAEKNYPQADDRLAQLLDEYPNDSRLFYLRGKVASSSAEGVFDQELLDERLGKAATYYRNAILSATPTTDKGLIAQSHVALGNILEFNEQNEAAIREFDAAISLGNKHKAYAEAIAGKARLTKKN